MNFRKALSHPVTLSTRRTLRRVVAISAVLLAVAFVTTISIDLGPSLRARAEQEASRFLKRQVHIGRLSVRLWNGRYQLEDFVIDGPAAGLRPFLTAESITISMPWSTLFNRRIVFDAIEMTDWRMVVESLPDGTHTFPSFPRPRGGGENRWTTTLQYVRAHRGEFIYEDHVTPWSVVTRNLDVIVSRPGSEYRGEAKFSNGTVAIMQYVPFRADMDTTFKIDGGRVVFDAINLATDGTRSVLKGDVNLAYWPEQMYTVQSTIDLPRMRQIFFAGDDFELAGTTAFDGVFHLFKDVRPDGTQRTGRELKGDFRSETAYVDDYRFDDLRGNVRWVPEALEVHDASARLYGGAAQFEYSMAPLGRRGARPVNRFDASYTSVDLTEFTSFLELEGIRLAGRASGENLLEWPSGQFSARRGGGEIRVTPPEGAGLLTRRMPVETLQARAESGDALGPFSPHTPREPVPIGGTVTYAFGPEWVDIAPSRIATATTYIELEGRTAYGDRSRIPFHVSSSDWQESDRFFAGVLTAFGARTNAIPIGGYGTFDGVMLGAFRRPRIEGTFAGEQIRAFDVVWGSVRGDAVIENSYADVSNVVVTSGTSTVHTDGRFSLGYPRRDGGEQINARIRIVRRPIADLKRAFGLDEYRLDGLFSGDFQVFGDYERPHGSGTMGITEGTAYGEMFETAVAGVQLEGNGIRLDNIQMVKGGGRGTGAAFVGWNGTYSFNFDASNIALESLNATSATTLPLSGLIDVTAGGSGTFDKPRYDVRGTIRDVFIADEGIGRVVGDLSINGDLMTLKLEAASSRLAVSGGGQIALTDAMDAELSFSVADTSLDPYIRAFQPQLSPYTNARASGTVRVYGELADIDQLHVDAVIDHLELGLFDYTLGNAVPPAGCAPERAPTGRCPIRVSLDRHTVRIEELRLVGQDTELDLLGVAEGEPALIDLHDEQIAMRASGTANLGILQGVVPNISSRGRAVVAATLQGPLRDPNVSGRMTVENGRIRHFGLPHALESITGVVAFDTREIRLDELSARLGGGPVQFGGTIGIQGYQLGRVDVTMTGEDMRLRFPADMTSTVDAQLALQGTRDALTLSGEVVVNDALYRGDFEGGSGFFDGGGDELSVPTFRESTLPLSYDVRIRAPSTLHVQNNLMRNFVASTRDLQLAGTYDRPLLFGQIEIDAGEIEFEGRRYVVRRGTIDFSNPTRIEPYFDIETEARVRVPGETYLVTVRAVGTDPISEMTFSSQPELPQYELLALLIADIPPGRDVEFRQYGEITPQEQLFRERVTRALTGVVASELSRVVEGTLGFDTFQLTTSLIDPNQQSARLDPAARVTVGKRLSETVYLTYSRSLSSATRDQIILLEIDQTDRLSWILSRNEDGTYALDLRVRRTFR